MKSLSELFKSKYTTDGKKLFRKSGKEIGGKRIKSGKESKGRCIIAGVEYFSDFVMYAMFNEVSEKAPIVHLDGDLFNNSIDNLMLKSDYETFDIKAKLNAYIEYNDGILTSKNTGEELGKIWDGGKYYEVNILGMRFTRAQVVWIMHNGEIPEGCEVDHINPEFTTDDRIEVLRLSTKSENQCNRRSKNKTGAKGVKELVLKDGTIKYQAQIKKLGEYHYLGTYSTVEKAKAARDNFADKLHGEFARS